MPHSKSPPLPQYHFPVPAEASLSFVPSGIMCVFDVMISLCATFELSNPA